MGFLQEAINTCPGTGLFADPTVSLRMPDIPGPLGQWSQMTPDSLGQSRMVDVYGFIPAANHAPAYYLILSDGDRCAVAVTAAAELAKWKHILPRPEEPVQRMIRAAVLQSHDMIPPSPPTLNRRLLAYIKEINGTSHVLRVDSLTFQGRGPLLRVPKLVAVPYDQFGAGDVRGQEGVQHDSYFDLTQRVRTFVGVRAGRFRPLEDSDDDDGVNAATLKDSAPHWPFIARCESSIESLPSDFEIPASIGPYSGTDSEDDHAKYSVCSN